MNCFGLSCDDAQYRKGLIDREKQGNSSGQPRSYN